MDEKHDAFLVFTQHGVERGIVGGTYTAVNTFGTLIPITRAHHHSTQGRAERQCTNHGKTYGGRHCHTELRIEDTGSTTHESYRHEHGHEHTGTRDNGHRYVAHRIFCSLVGRGVARIEFRLYGFHHHDRVVHHRTDGKHQGEQGQDVDRESGGCQTGECTDQRNDDRNRRDQRTLEVLKEEIHHKDYEDDRHDQRFYHIIYRSEEEVVGAHHRDKFRSCRQFLFHLFQFGGNTFVYFRCVRAGYLVDHECHGRLTVHLAVEAVTQCPQLDLGDIFQAQYRTVFLSPDDDVLEFFHALQTSAVFHCVLENVFRVFTQRTGRSLDILFSQYGSHIRRNQSVLGHSFGVQPDTHTVGIAQLHHIAYAFDTFDTWDNVDVEVVSEKCLVITSIGADKCVDLQETGLSLLGADTDTGYFGGQ